MDYLVHIHCGYSIRLLARAACKTYSSTAYRKKPLQRGTEKLPLSALALPFTPLRAEAEEAAIHVGPRAPLRPRTIPTTGTPGRSTPQCWIHCTWLLEEARRRLGEVEPAAGRRRPSAKKGGPSPHHPPQPAQGAGRGRERRRGRRGLPRRVWLLGPATAAWMAAAPLLGPPLGGGWRMRVGEGGGGRTRAPRRRAGFEEEGRPRSSTLPASTHISACARSRGRRGGDAEHGDGGGTDLGREEPPSSPRSPRAGALHAPFVQPPLVLALARGRAREGGGGPAAARCPGPRRRAGKGGEPPAASARTRRR